MNRSRFAVICLTLWASLGSASPADAQELTPKLYDSMRWRMIGPFRGGRAVGAVGIPSQPNVFFVGVNNGGVWKTNDYGRTWKPIFDDQPTGSIGSLAVAPSNPDILYVGSGEGLQRPDLSVGDGIYKSTDGGKTWKHMGLSDGQQIPAVVVDPRDPNRVFVAVLGHPYGANPERGVFRSTDGGKTWEKVLYKDENTGAMALEFDVANPQIIYASLWSARQGPWENGAWRGATSGLFKSTDGGTTWTKLTKGLPGGLGRIGIGICRSDPKCIFTMVQGNQSGIYRSDDGGENWKLINSEQRLFGRGDDFAEIKVDPKNKDILYVANTCSYRSTDGGKTFIAYKGAPGGDDPHTFWINPDNTQIILLAGDQGACITVNGGETWSSWYNQPTAQLYHVITDNQFPYWVYGAQQESGSAGVASRGKDGQITFRDWHPVGVSEYGYVAPDPLNPRYIYGGKVTRYDMVTGEVENVGPGGGGKGKGMGGYRTLRTAPLVFSTVDPHVLFYGTNVLLKTSDGGKNWQEISKDLTRPDPEVPDSIGIFKNPQMAKMARRGVIYTVAPSYKDVNVIWCGTDDGLIQMTKDGGKNWENVTPPALTSWSKVSVMDAGRFDANTAYAAINRFRLDDLKPHIYRTHDGGKTWKEIVKGLPDDPINAVREDPKRAGLLFCGSERAVFVSFNDGDDWQPLRLNMPATSIRDLVIHDDDVVVGTHGRSFWILDDITPLRQLDAKVAAAPAHLFKPQAAYRVKWNVNKDTPLPPEEPGGKNPPDGAIINYYLNADAKGVVTLEIFDDKDKLVRSYSSKDVAPKINENTMTVPSYWVRPPQILSAKAGSHRFIWDLSSGAGGGGGGGKGALSMAAIYKDTPMGRGPMVMPGEYKVKLTVDGQSQTQPLTLKRDPRVTTPLVDEGDQ
jgi:photosystem II stability/assembly factor-like uncharacterized protein